MAMASGCSAGFLDFASLGMTAIFGDIGDISMLLQELMQVFGQLAADTFG